jgi:hypothetical protein
VHLIELRDGANAVRAGVGLAPYSFTDTITAGVSLIRALHVQQLRSALE